MFFCIYILYNVHLIKLHLLESIYLLDTTKKYHTLLTSYLWKSGRFYWKFMNVRLKIWNAFILQCMSIIIILLSDSFVEPSLALSLQTFERSIWDMPILMDIREHHFSFFQTRVYIQAKSSWTPSSWTNWSYISTKSTSWLIIWK